MNLPRRGHAVLDLASRRLKARKIERLLGLDCAGPPLRLLEVGTGVGGIAHYFGTEAMRSCAVTSVDVTDVRGVHDGFVFRQVEGTALPFAAASFDVVLSNHVIEHVGDDEAQLEHLREMRRVLTPGGIAYLAVPNRWMLVEPHYRLAFLSWWPASVRSAWLRLWRAGTHYDCRPFSRRPLEAMLRDAGWQYRHLHPEALTVTLAIERPGSLACRVAQRVPGWAWRATAGLVPTLIYGLRPAAGPRRDPTRRGTP